MTSRATPTKPHPMVLPSHSHCVSWMLRIQQRPAGPPRRWQIQRCKEPRSLNDCMSSLSTWHLILQGPSMWPGCLRVVRLLTYGGWLLKSQCSTRPRGKLPGSFYILSELTAPFPPLSTGYEQVTELALTQRGDCL